MKMKIKLKNVQANPFRHIERYPIQQKKIDALKRSIEDTDFWENIVARDMGDGNIQIAYGHHRLSVLKDMYSGTKIFDFIIKDLDDTTMCKIMVSENMEEWGSDAAVEQESIRAIVEGYAAGSVELPELATNTDTRKIRYAPSFRLGSKAVADELPYTSSQLVTFTGWKEWKVKAALAALEKIESGDVKESAYRGVSTEQQVYITKEANKIIRNTELEVKKAEKEGDVKAVKEIRRRGKADVTTATKVLNKGFSSGTLGKRDASERVREVIARKKDRNEYPDIKPVTERLSLRIENLLTENGDVGKKIYEIVKYKKLLDDKTLATLRMSLRVLADEANNLAKKLK